MPPRHGGTTGPSIAGPPTCQLGAPACTMGNVARVGSAPRHPIVPGGDHAHRAGRHGSDHAPAVDVEGAARRPPFRAESSSSAAAEVEPSSLHDTRTGPLRRPRRAGHREGEHPSSPCETNPFRPWSWGWASSVSRADAFARRELGGTLAAAVTGAGRLGRIRASAGRRSPPSCPLSREHAPPGYRREHRLPPSGSQFAVMARSTPSVSAASPSARGALERGGGHQARRRASPRGPPPCRASGSWATSRARTS